jgi:tetratricopeptide (TPR) repeat protein
MDGQISKSHTVSCEITNATTAAAVSDANHQQKCIIRNYLLILIDVVTDQSNNDCQNILAQLQNVVNDVNVFTERDKCVDFLTDNVDMKAFMIVSDDLGQQIIPLIHDILQLDDIYILCSNTTEYEKWTKQWGKIKGVHTEIASICESVIQAVKQCHQDSIAVSFIPVSEAISSQNLDQLEPSFMYTQIFKEILLGMEHNQQSIKDFTDYCRKGDYGSPTNINRFENEYNADLAIWWYTYPSFIYSLLNGALRMLEVDTIICMGFFIHDLHHQIEQLHQKQISSDYGRSFVVYRGQGLSTEDFEKLLQTKGGLMSFNNFLSTSRERELSLDFAQVALTKTDTVGTLFQMTIDSSITSTPFAAIREFSSFYGEEEILFSMHAVFRIDDITEIDKNNSLYQVELTLTADDDRELRILTDKIRDEAGVGSGWDRLSRLLMKMGHASKAEEVVKLLLEQTPDECDKAYYSHQLGQIENDRGDYEKAILYYERAQEIYKRTFPPNHPVFPASYNNIGLVYMNMGEYSKALSFYEKTLEMNQRTLPPNHPLFAQSYNNIGGVYCIMEEYSKAVSFYKKALEIRYRTHPSNHPDLATSNNNIGGVYDSMGEYSKALSFYKKALEILQKSLPENHPNIASSYNNIGAVYDNMGEYSKALSFYEKALEINQKNLPIMHPSLAISYNNIGLIHMKMREYSKAFSFSEKALEIRQKALLPNHPYLATSYNNIGLVYDNVGEYSKALSFYEKALEIRQKAFPPNHPDFAQSYNNIGSVYVKMKDYSKALSFYEKALEIRQTALPSNHPSLATSYNNIAILNYNMENYSTAVSYFERALDIWQSLLPFNHPHLESVRKGIEIVKKELIN